MRVKKCLIIENEPYLAESIAGKLEDIGFETKILSSTKEALTLDEKFSAVLLSSNLHDEVSFFKTIKKFRKATVILMISYINNDLISKAVELGADDYILKPFKTDVLIQKLISFQRITDLEDREKKYLKFLNAIFSDNPIKDASEIIRLPLILYSKTEKTLDAFVFFFAKREKKLIEVVEAKDIKSISEDSDIHTIYYLKKFANLSKDERGEVLQSINNSINIIIGTTTLDGVDTSQYNFKEIETEPKLIENGEILTVSEYIKQTIINNQYRMPDTEISKHLGISRKSLWEKRRKFNIQKKKKG